MTQKFINCKKKKNDFFAWLLQILSDHVSLKDATNDNRLVFMILTENEVSLGHEQQHFKKRPTLKNNAIKI